MPEESLDLMVGSEVLQRSTMFIALIPLWLCAPAERNVLQVLVYIPLLTERVNHRILGYKHFAPPEQCQSDFSGNAG